MLFRSKRGELWPLVLDNVKDSIARRRTCRKISYLPSSLCLLQGPHDQLRTHFKSETRCASTGMQFFQNYLVMSTTQRMQSPLFMYSNPLLISVRVD